MYVQMQGGGYQYFSDVSSGLDFAIRDGGIPLDDSGNPMDTQSFLPGYGLVPLGTPGSGYLVNGCPLNVALAQGFLPGQQAVLQDSGIDCQTSNASGGCGCGCVRPGGGSRNNQPGQASPWNPVTYGNIGGDNNPEVETMSAYSERIINFARQYGQFKPIQGTV